MIIDFGERKNNMAKRICFLSTPNDRPIYKEVLIDFTFFTGFAVSQKQKSIASMHESILNYDKNLNILEVSTKSTSSTGVELSAFNLKFFDKLSEKEYPIENIFQSSKVFENGGPFKDLLYVHPKESKRDERLKTSGELIGFNYNDVTWELEPKTLFYDWIYINSLNRNKNLSIQILDYDAFTDIEFNQEKSINCQARSAAIFVSLKKNGKLEEVLNDKKEFIKIYSSLKYEEKKLSLFD